MADAGDRQQQQQQPRGLKDLFVNIVEQKIELLLWLSRMACLSFSILYLLGGLGGNPHSHYQKALISNAVTSALRLHQRMPTIRLNAEFFANLMIEDSFHYLLFSLIFIFAAPLSVIVLFPPALFALLHSTSFSLQLLDKAGLQNSKIAQSIRSLHQNHRVKLFQLIAMSEIMLMPMVIVGLFTGRALLMTPVIYYRFLTQRYASRRNPYTRNVFFELRIQFQILGSHRMCPAIVNRFIHAAIAFISARAPPHIPPPQGQAHSQ